MIVVKNKTKQKLFLKHEQGNQLSLEFSIDNPSLFEVDDNQQSLTLFYGFLDQKLNDLSCSAFIAKKLIEHGIDGLKQCYGSFIALHFNKITKQWLLANDALGDFALHYIHKENQIYLADMPESLLPYVNNQINQLRVIDYFALTQPQKEGCYFKNIHQLSPGHYLSIKNNTLSNNRYYYPEEQVNFKNHCVEGLAEQYLALIKEAIYWQSYKQKKVGIMMSGGLDSTFVASNCIDLGKQVSTFSYVFPEIQQADESKWILSMQKFNLNISTFAGEQYWPLKSKWQISKNSPVSNPYRHLKDNVYQQVYANNIKILFVGVCADHLYSAHIYWLTDLIKNQPVQAIEATIKTLWKYGIKGLIRQVSPSKWSSSVKSNPYWLSSWAQDLFTKKNVCSFNHPHPQTVNLVYGIDNAQGVWLENEYTNKYNIHIRDPYRHRKVVEFMCSIPAWVVGNPAQTKSFAQFCAKDFLPKKIISRENKASLTPFFVQGVLDKEIEKVKGILKDSECQWTKYIDSKIILQILKHPNKPVPELYYLLLWKCISFELWRKSFYV